MFPQSGMGSGPGGYYQQTDAQDFASLPPIVNMMGGSSEMENNSTDVLDGSGSNPNISRGYVKYVDPLCYILFTLRYHKFHTRLLILLVYFLLVSVSAIPAC